MTVLTWVGGESVAPDQIHVNSGLNFGRLFPDQPTTPFRLEVALNDLLWLAPEWHATALEMNIDDQLDEEPSAFHGVNYDPEIVHAWQHPAAFCAIVDMFFTRTILDTFFEGTQASSRWVINGITALHLKDDRLVLEGWVV